MRNDTNTIQELTEQQKELLKKGLADLHSFADAQDIALTAAHVKRNDGTVRRYLRGDIPDWDTAKQIHDHLRKLTIARAHGTLQTLNAA